MIRTTAFPDDHRIGVLWWPYGDRCTAVLPKTPPKKRHEPPGGLAIGDHYVEFSIRDAVRKPRELCAALSLIFYATPEMLIEDRDALAFAVVMTARRAVGVDQ